MTSNRDGERSDNLHAATEPTTEGLSLSEELFYSGEKGDVDRCLELLNNGADVNWKASRDLWFRTPLMQAAKSGMTDVCQLYIEHSADVNACTVSKYTALILAARYGKTEVCKLLLSKGADVNSQTKEGETALMWAAHGGYCNTCKLLLESGAKVDLQDVYGFTALIHAARDGHMDTCIVLLDFGADVNAVSKLGNKVFDAEDWARANKHKSIIKLLQSYKVRCSLLKDGSDPPSYVTLNVCGAVNAGKTTLVEKLQMRPIQLRLRHDNQPDTSQDMASRTAGIEVGIINVPGVGEFRKMDMAGHTWAFTSNEYFIGKRTSISLVLFDLSKTDSEVEDDLFHHLGSLKARETKCGVLRYRPEVVLIASHADKMATDPQVRANAYFRIAMNGFQAYLNFYPRVMVLDCTNPNNREFNALRECLKELRAKIIKTSERVPRLCAQLLPYIRTWAKERPSFPVASWQEFVKIVKEINKSADEEGVRNVAYYLNESAEIVNDNSPELRDKVILDVNWLTSHIFGIALAPANFPRSLRIDRVSGMVEKRELQATFPECPLEQLIELFVRFEVCLPWDEQHLICENYLFPSHLEQNRSNLDDVWPQFDTDGDGICVVGRIVECKNEVDTLPCSFFPKFQIRLLSRFGHRSPVWHGGIKIADDAVEILATLSSSLKAVNFCVWAPKGCEERCYSSMKFIESLRDGLLDEVAGGVEFEHKALSIKMLHHKKFEGYPVKEVDDKLHEDGPNARVVLESCGINERAVDVMYCGIRRYIFPPDHISHLAIRDRKELAQLLDTGSDSNHLKSLSEQLEVKSLPVEHEDSEDMEVSGFTNVISGSETDRYLSRCALGSDLRAKDLIEALERINRFDAATVISRWLSSVNKAQQTPPMYKTRGESSASERSCSVSSRRRGTSGASEHSEIRTRSMRGSSASDGSPLLPTRSSIGSGRGPCSCVCSRHSFDTSSRKESGASENSLPFDSMNGAHSRGASIASGGSFNGTTSQQRVIDLRHGFRSASSSSACSHPTEECYYGSEERLSCEESQINGTEQIVPQPRLLIHPCRNCQHCAQKLPVEDTGDDRVRLSVEETSKDTHAKSRDAELELISTPVQVSNSDIKKDVSNQSTEESLPTAETCVTDDNSTLPMRSLIPELSSRLSLSWRPVAVDLGFRRSELGCFEQPSLLRMQASHMLHSWLSKNKCTLGCQQCQGVLLEILGEAFENAHRADLKDFLQHSRAV
ncbi:hypothetical protein ACROYT_G028047 [Oculina patagonica]